MERMFMKGIGLIMLLFGAGLIAYAFNASDSANSAVNSVLAQLAASLPTNQTVWLLIGGSGAVVLGMVMIFRRPARVKSGSTN
jgi:hypothetical protein